MCSSACRKCLRFVLHAGGRGSYALYGRGNGRCALYARSAEGVLYVLDVSEVVVPYIVTIRLTERFRVK